MSGPTVRGFGTAARSAAATRRRPGQSDVTPTSFLESCGAIRPSRSRTALIVSANPAVRADWARCFEALGMRTLRCVGPQVLCVLLDGGRWCPLQGEADLAVYDEAALTPELILRLIRVSRSLPIVFAKDRLDAAGHHEPVITSVASHGRDDDACVGVAAFAFALEPDQDDDDDD